jgi:CheY-like chemotaxis protein/DNA-binding XRE family transcriptional regulator
MSAEITIPVHNKEVQSQFGLVVRAWRSRRGISQEELAERAGLHRTYVSDVERGNRNVSLTSIERLAVALEVSASQLFASIGNAGAPAGGARSTMGGQLVDILFVEDRAEDAELTMHALQSAHIANRIHLVRDGESAIEFLFGQRTPGGGLMNRPQLILLDLGLPRMSGQEVLQRIKSDVRTRDIPVIVLTASSRDRDLVASRQMGADAYIVKPVDFQNLSEVAPRLKLYWALLHGPVSESSQTIKIS